NEVRRDQRAGADRDAATGVDDDADDGVVAHIDRPALDRLTARQDGLFSLTFSAAAADDSEHCSENKGASDQSHGASGSRSERTLRAARRPLMEANHIDNVQDVTRTMP